MSPSNAILVGAILIASTVMFVGSMHSAQAQKTGPFMIMHHSNTQANAGVFRVDTATGDVSFCYIANGTGTELVCTKEVR